MTDTKTAAIVIKTWKLPVFERRLREAGRTFTTTNTTLAGKPTTIIKVAFERRTEIAMIQPIVQAAQNECAAMKKGTRNDPRN